MKVEQCSCIHIYIMESLVKGIRKNPKQTDLWTVMLHLTNILKALSHTFYFQNSYRNIINNKKKN